MNIFTKSIPHSTILIPHFLIVTCHATQLKISDVYVVLQGVTADFPTITT
jgi:hypothetical protein